MRILHVVDFFGHEVTKGGVVKAAGLLARGQVRVGADVTVFTTNAAFGGTQPNPVVENREGVWVHFFTARWGARRCFSLSLLQACRERVRDFDIVHIHGLWTFPGVWGALMARRFRIPYVVSPHGMLNEWAMRFRAYKKVPYWYAIERHKIRGAAWVHFVTEEESRQAQGWVGDKKSKVIPIGLDVDEFAALPTCGEFRDRHNLPRAVPLLAFLGRIHPIKGLEVLLQALVRVKAEVPEVILVIAGPDEDGYGVQLHTLAQDLGLHDQVRWVGAVEGQAKAGFLVDADLFVLPSFSENFGLSAVEAMALGCPVIVGSGVNIACQVEAYDAGWVVSTEPEAIATAIVGALRNHERRQAMKQAGRRLVSELYDREAVARQMLKGYEECLS